MKEHHVPEFYQSPWAGTDGELNRHQLNRANARILRKPLVATNDEGIQKRIQSSSPAEFLRLMNEESLNRAKELVFSCDESNMDLISTMVERRTSGAA